MITCPKCRSRRIIGPAYEQDTSGRERLRYRCSTCGYSECTACADSPEVEQQEGRGESFEDIAADIAKMVSNDILFRKFDHEKLAREIVKELRLASSPPVPGEPDAWLVQWREPLGRRACHAEYTEAAAKEFLATVTGLALRSPPPTIDPVYMKSTAPALKTNPAIRARIRELALASPPDDYDRAVLMLLDDFEASGPRDILSGKGPAPDVGDELVKALEDALGDAAQKEATKKGMDTAEKLRALPKIGPDYLAMATAQDAVIHFAKSIRSALSRIPASGEGR